MKYSDTVLLIFAKAPVAGKVNTRLIPTISVEKATQLQHDLIHQRLSEFDSILYCDVVLYCLPDSEAEFFKQCADKYAVTLKNQQGANLGERMANAIEVESAIYNNVVLIGTDAPSLKLDNIESAILALKDNDIVVAPAEDGGYVLIAMKQYNKSVFLSVPWGTDRVLVKTRANVVATGLKMFELGVCWDIDRPEDYYRYLSEFFS